MPALYLDCISRCNPLAASEHSTAGRQSKGFTSYGRQCCITCLGAHTPAFCIVLDPLSIKIPAVQIREICAGVQLGFAPLSPAGK
jgi:hypothetical protein